MRSGPRFVLGVAALATSVLVACGLDVVGDLGPASSLGDAAVPTEPEPPPEQLGDGGEGPTFDAALPGETVSDGGPVDSGPCGPRLLEENFAQGLGSWTHYGGVEQGVSGGNAYARLIAQGSRYRAAGLFWLPTVKATSFKASFTYYVSTPTLSLGKGDGLTFTWLTSKGAEALGTNAVTGQGLGLPPGVAGYAVALDGWQNLSIGDPGDPSLSLLEIDPARGSPGSYDWHIAKKGPYYESDLYDAWRTIEVVVANGKASAVFRFSANGPPTTLFADVAVDADDVIGLGFTAATGSVDAMGFFVDTVRFELTDASCN